MKDPLEHEQSRREFFRSLGRNFLLGGSAVVSGVLVVRSWEQNCISRGRCRACPQFTCCGLPQALSTKQQIGAANHAGVRETDLQA